MPPSPSCLPAFSHTNIHLRAFHAPQVQHSYRASLGLVATPNSSSNSSPTALPARPYDPAPVGQLPATTVLAITLSVILPALAIGVAITFIVMRVFMKRSLFGRLVMPGPSKDTTLVVSGVVEASSSLGCL